MPRVPIKAAIPPSTTRADGTAHQDNDTLIWSATLSRWVSATGSDIDDLVPKYQTYTATCTAKDALYMTAAGTAARAKADSIATMYFIGFATETKTAASCIVQTGGVITITGKTFTPGLPVYVDKTTAGNVVQDISAYVVGDLAQKVGIALTATDVLIQPGPVVGVTSGLTLPVSGTIATSATPYPSSDGTATGTQVEFFTITALAAAAELQAPVGTPTNGQRLMVRILDNNTARALTYVAIYRASTDMALPATTVQNKTMYLNFIYNSAASKWDFIGYLDNF